MGVLAVAHANSSFNSIIYATTNQRFRYGKASWKRLKYVLKHCKILEKIQNSNYFTIRKHRIRKITLMPCTVILCFYFFCVTDCTVLCKIHVIRCRIGYIRLLMIDRCITKCSRTDAGYSSQSSINSRGSVQTTVSTIKSTENMNQNRK